MTPLKSRVLVLLVIALAIGEANAQYGKRPSGIEKFLKTQWWLGLRLGGSITAAEPDVRYSGFSPINYGASLTEKVYDDYSSFNGMAGLEITFYHRGFSFSLQPNYRRQKFTYSNEYAWSETADPDNVLDLRYAQDHLLDYVEIPLFIKYDLMQGKARPFVQIGGYYAFSVGATKSIDISGEDRASGNTGPFERQTTTIGADDLFIKSSVGLAGGVGVSYDLWNVRLIFDITYRHGLNNITDVKNRFSSNQLSSIGDALDDMTLRNVNFSLGCVFPLRFITKSNQSIN